MSVFLVILLSLHWLGTLTFVFVQLSALKLTYVSICMIFNSLFVVPVILKDLEPRRKVIHLSVGSSVESSNPHGAEGLPAVSPAPPLLAITAFKPRILLRPSLPELLGEDDYLFFLKGFLWVKRENYWNVKQYTIVCCPLKHQPVNNVGFGRKVACFLQWSCSVWSLERPC